MRNKDVPDPAEKMDSANSSLQRRRHLIAAIFGGLAFSLTALLVLLGGRRVVYSDWSESLSQVLQLTLGAAVICAVICGWCLPQLRQKTRLLIVLAPIATQFAAIQAWKYVKLSIIHRDEVCVAADIVEYRAAFRYVSEAGRARFRSGTTDFYTGWESPGVGRGFLGKRVVVCYARKDPRINAITRLTSVPSD